MYTMKDTAQSYDSGVSAASDGAGTEPPKSGV